MTARVLSCNVGEPTEVRAGNRTVLTGIFKRPVTGRVRVLRFNLEGDRQADLTVHGGPYKAVYAYPSEHYPWWREQLPDTDMEPGMFGENLTTEGVLETDVPIGQQLRAGTALLQVTQPRMPCFKLALKFNRSDIIKRFWKSGRSGFYLSVIEEGEVEAGDAIELAGSPSKPFVTIAEVVTLYRDPDPPRERLEAALASSLATSWKKSLRERLTQAVQRELLF